VKTFKNFQSLFLAILSILNLNVSPKSIAEIIYNKRLSSGTKKVLLWTSLYDLRTWGWKETLQEDELKRWGCKVTNCYITSNKKYRDVLWYDAVMFHGGNVNMSNLPPRRSPKQLYIFFVQEPPMFYFFRVSRLPDSFFNWTRSFKLYLTTRVTI
jgi:alpha-1,3-fucosyltransferase